MDHGSSRGLDRREFVKAAVAIGGTGALGACLDAERSTPESGSGGTETPAFPTGTDDGDSLPTGQHRWNDYLVNTASGTFAQTQHQLLLGLTYEGSVPPTEAERTQVEEALGTLERAFQWGTGDATSAGINNGLLFTMGYAQNYFDKLGASVDELTPPEDVLEAVGGDPEKAAEFDALLLLAADFGSILLSAEEAIVGDADTVNGVSVDATFDDVFSVAERRTGFVGKGIPAEELDNDDIPDEAPLSMGFRSAFADALPSEDRVTIQEGYFEGGTTQAVSRLKIDLEGWYEGDDDNRRKKMFSPTHTEEEVGKTGQRLGQSSNITKEHVDNIEEHAGEHGVVGHSAKTAKARDENFNPIILRRSEGVATDETGGNAFNFTSVQRTVEDFIETRKAMNIDEHDADVPDEEHGIVSFLETVSRGTYLLPPREKRALPDPS